MEESTEPPVVSNSLRGIRVAAMIGTVVALALVVVGFSTGIVFGLVALFALPAIPLIFVLGFEAVVGTRAE
ncbi:MAG: hypothetical protein RIB98_08370 [Acidimicrobiales bacterium]